MTLISTGGMLKTTAGAADLLAAQGISACVLSMHTIKPLDTEAVQAAARETRAIVSVEEHSVVGGLGSAVAEVLAEVDMPHAPLRRFGLTNDFVSLAGDQTFLREKHGLSSETIQRLVLKEWAASYRGNKELSEDV